MTSKPRYATVRKYATRELLSGNFQHAIFGVKVSSDENVLKVILANTPEEIVYFLDDNSYIQFVEKIKKQFSVVVEFCSVHR